MPRLLTEDHAHLRCLPAEVPQDARHQRRRHRVEEGQPDGARVRIEEVGDVVAELVVAPDDVPRRGEREGTVGIEPHPAGVPLEQAGAQFVLDTRQ